MRRRGAHEPSQSIRVLRVSMARVSYYGAFEGVVRRARFWAWNLVDKLSDNLGRQIGILLQGCHHDFNRYVGLGLVPTIIVRYECNRGIWQLCLACQLSL